MTDNVQELEKALIDNNPILFLGAGFSYKGINSFGEIPTGKELTKEIFDKFVAGNVDHRDAQEIESFNLQDMCQFVDTNLEKKDELRAFLIERLSDVEPQDFHMCLPSYPWKKIYTVNIDDLVERIYWKAEEKIIVQNGSKKKDSGEDVEYIKLHGCVKAPDQPFVFSRTEYTNLISSKINFKLNDLVSDIQREDFIFVGASLDESDIDYYITQYENAGYFRKRKLFFVDPKPSVKLRGRVKELGGRVIEWTAEEFLLYVKKLDYNPSELEKIRNRLNYSGIFLYKDIINSLPKSETYESRLYEGFNAKWQDVIEGWLFENPAEVDIKKKIDSIDFKNYSSYCLALFGRSFSGKDCILKQLGHYLDNIGYQVLEYNGKSWDIKTLKEYIQKEKQQMFALLIGNASFYYKIIEKLLQSEWNGNKLLIVSTSRKYYHVKKRYYLEGNPYEEIYITDKINVSYAGAIFDKLKEKGYLGHLPLDRERSIPQIVRKANLINFFTNLTYGEGFKKRISKTIKDILDSDEQIKNLYVELSIFDKADLTYYPYELLTARYSIDFNMFQKDRYNDLSDEQRLIVDYVRIDETGVSLKNELLVDNVWKKMNVYDTRKTIMNILKSISGKVSEHEDGYWRIIFESLLKEDRLEKRFKFKMNDILTLYYDIKEEFDGISYYWLQLGIAEQRNNDYTKALNHLNMARSIRPRAYQIQHAIARNYLKHANYIKDIITAKALFEEGEKNMLELINSREHYKNKAKNYSIHCYIFEKIKFILKHNLDISNSDLNEMKWLLDSVKDDDYVKGLKGDYVKLLKQKDKLGLLRMKLGDDYFEAIGKEVIIDDGYDKLVDSY